MINLDLFTSKHFDSSGHFDSWFHNWLCTNLSFRMLIHFERVICLYFEILPLSLNFSTTCNIFWNIFCIPRAYKEFTCSLCTWIRLIIWVANHFLHFLLRFVLPGIIFILAFTQLQSRVLTGLFNHSLIFNYHFFSIKLLPFY